MVHINSCSGWPLFRWNSDQIAPVLGRVSYRLGIFAERMRHLDERAGLEATEAVSSAEACSLASMAAVISQESGPAWAAGARVVIEDIFCNTEGLLTATRIFSWHRALSEVNHATVGWRDNFTDFQSATGSHHTPTTLPPPPEELPEEMKTFLAWFNFGSLPSETGTPLSALWQLPLLRAGIAHFWITALQPVENNSSALAGAICNLALLRADPGKRWYSLLECILAERGAYTKAISDAMNPELDITPWLLWFFEALENSVREADRINSAALERNGLFTSMRQSALHERQQAALSYLLDGESELSSGMYASLTGCSGDTALRDIQKLLELGLLRKNSGGGRSTTYSLKL